MKYALVYLFLITTTAMAQTDSTLPNFDKLWNFGDPTSTEKKFMDLLPQAKASGDKSYYLQLLTQIARTHSLRGDFAKAHAILDEVEEQLGPNERLARVRYLLERGRSFNSAGTPEKALPLFIEAYELGESVGDMRQAIDAVHMVAIAQGEPQKQVEWNLKGITLTDAYPEQKGWLNALYNNIGESYLKLSDFANAQKYFHKLADFQRERQGEAEIYTVKDEAKAFRLMGKPQESLGLMMPIFEKLSLDKQDDGWIREEIAEALYALGNTADAKPHFLKAYEILSTDTYCLQYEPQKIKYLKKMSEDRH